MSKLIVTAGGFTFEARLEEANAPRTCAAFRQLMPLTSQIVHVRWSGEGVWVPLGDTDFGIGYENHTSHPAPGQIILFVNGLQWKRYKRYDMTITGESACSDSWGRALATKETSISIPCFAERRYGGVADDELLIAMPPDEFVRGIEGLEGLSKVGLRYPIVPYGPQADPSEGMSRSYS